MQVSMTTQLHLQMRGSSGETDFATVQLLRYDHPKLLLRLIAGDPALLNRHAVERTITKFQLHSWGNTRWDSLWESAPFRALLETFDERGELELTLLEKVDFLPA